jgi:aminodeoxyfutalosine deaminase
LIQYQAAWVLPIDCPPIRHGTVSVEFGRIVRVDDHPRGAVHDLGSVAILPGLVNAHTHLELSWMRGRVGPMASMPQWAGALIALRRTVSQDLDEAIVSAIADVRASGTCLVGDVANTLSSYQPLVNSSLSAALFRELIGFSVSHPDELIATTISQIAALRPSERIRPSVVPHAPYSVSPALFGAIARCAAGRPISVHLAESPEEVQFLRDGTGGWRTLLETLGAWNEGWTPPGCGPVEYLDRLGLVASNLLAVHGVHLTDAELSRLAAAGSTLVTCPRSNRWTGAGAPPLERFYRSGVRVAVGTDSLASVDDLNLFMEVAEMRRLAPTIRARDILASATRAGADALGFGADLGTLAPGKHAQIIAVRIPADVMDVEEYLLSGIESFDVRWVNPEPEP